MGNTSLRDSTGGRGELPLAHLTAAGAADFESLGGALPTSPATPLERWAMPTLQLQPAGRGALGREDGGRCLQRDSSGRPRGIANGGEGGASAPGVDPSETALREESPNAAEPRPPLALRGSDRGEGSRGDAWPGASGPPDDIEATPAPGMGWAGEHCGRKIIPPKCPPGKDLPGGLRFCLLFRLLFGTKWGPRRAARPRANRARGLFDM